MKTLNVSVNVIGEMMLLRKCHKSRDFGIFWMFCAKGSDDEQCDVVLRNAISNFVDEFVIFYPLMMLFCSENLITILQKTSKANLICHLLLSRVGGKQFHEKKMRFFSGLCGCLKEFFAWRLTGFSKPNETATVAISKNFLLVSTFCHCSRENLFAKLIQVSFLYAAAPID